MYQSINFYGFCDAFVRMDRNENFSYEGKRALFDYLESYEEESGESLELDIIALCCEYSEEPLKDVLENYNLESLEQLEDSTQVIGFDKRTGLVLYQVF
jgi:hypothetical protein